MRLAPIVAACWFVLAPAVAGQLAGVSLPDEDSAGGRALTLNGIGLREATLLKVDVYVAGLYLEERSSDARAILASEGAKRIRMRFVRNVSRDELAKAWEEGFERNVADVEPHRQGLAALVGAMSDVRKGDDIVITTVPGQGTTVTVKGKDAATIPDEGFGKAIWSLWLGPKPPNPGLKAGLLGDASP